MIPQKDPLGILGGQPKDKKQADPLGILKKKEVSEPILEIGGEVGVSAPPLRKDKVLDYLALLKTPAVQVSTGDVVSREDAVLPIQKPKKIDTNFGLTKERIATTISPKIEEISIDADPVGTAERKASQTKNLQEASDYIVAADIYKQLSIPSGYDAYVLSASPLVKEDNATSRVVLTRANQYAAATEGLRQIKAPDLKGADEGFIEMNVMPQIERAAVMYSIKANPSFEKELAAAGTSIDDSNLKQALGSAKMGSIMESFLESPEVSSFAKSENPNLAIALQYAKDKNLDRNTEYGISSVANKVSREFERSENRRTSIAPFATEQLKKDIDDVAKDKLNPQEYNIYQNYIKGNEEQYLDTPSFLTGFAEEGKKVFQGFLNTLDKVSGQPKRDAIREQWRKEATNVSANPEGWRSFMSESGKMSGLVATLAGTGNILGGAARLGTVAETRNIAQGFADAVNIGTAFWGDMVDQGIMKYPDSPVKAFTSAGLNTLMFMAMGRNIFPAKQVESAFVKIQPEVEQVVKNLTNGSITREVARRELNTIAKKGIDIASGGVIQNTKVAGELTGLGVLNEGLDTIMDMDEDKMRKYYPEGVHGDTFKSMFLGNALVSSVAGYGKYRVKNNIARDAIYEAANNPKRYERIINDLVIKDPNVSKEELLNNLAFAVETKRLLDQRGVSEPKQKEYLLRALGERAATIEKERISDSTLKKEAEERIKQAQAEKEAILTTPEEVNPAIPVTEEEAAPQEGEAAPQVPKPTIGFTARGGNKIVDEKGEPITLLHGTNNDKIKFDEGTVFYATDDKQFAGVYGENILPVKISLKNPYDLTDSTDGIIKDRNGEPMLDKEGVPYSINYIDESVVKDLKSRGFDGVRMGNESVIAFDKSQVKEITPELPAAPIEELPFGEVAPREEKTERQVTNIKERSLNVEAANPLVEVLQYFISGGKINPKALTEFFGKERRMGMGKIRVNERKSRTALTNKNAPSIDALAEKIAGTDRLDRVQEYREAIEEVLLSHTGTETMQEEVVRDYDVDFAEAKQRAELEEMGKDIEEETKAIVSRIPEAQQNEILAVIDRFRDEQGFVDWRRMSEELKEGFDPLLIELSEQSQKIINDAIKQVQETGRVSRISPEAIPTATKAGDILRRAAEATRAGKISKLGGFRAGTGFDAVWDTSLEVIAKALDGGASVADAIEQGLKYVKSTGWYKKLTDKTDFDNKYRSHLKSEYDAIQEPTTGEVSIQPEARAGKEMAGGIPPTEPPGPPKEGKGPGKVGKKTLLNRIIDSPDVPQAVKDAIQEKGLSYVPATHLEATRLANSIIDAVGIDEAVLIASKGGYSDSFGGLNTAVLSEAASRLVTDPIKQAQVFDILDQGLRSKGQDISYMNEFYTKNPEGVVIYQNQQRKNDFNQWAASKEKAWQEAYDTVKKEVESLKEELAAEKAKPEATAVKAAKDKITSARQKRASLIEKYKKNKGGGLTLTSGGLTKEGIEFVGEVALTYIQEGVANAEVLIQKVLSDVRNTLGKEPSDDIRNEIDQIVRRAFNEKRGQPTIDRIRKKLDGLSGDEKQDVIRKSYKKLIESNALDFEDFKDIIAETLNRGPLSEEDAVKLKQLTKTINEVEAKALEAQEQRTPEALRAYKKAQDDAAVANRALSLLFNNKPNILKRITSFIQLSTLGIPALINNVGYNVVNQAFLRFPIGLTNTLLDRAISGAARITGKRFNPETNVLSRQTQREFFSKLSLGLREASEQVLTGLNRQDYIQKEVYSQPIQPFESAKAIYKGWGKMPLKELVDKGLQATVGVPAEVVARLLNLGDKPLRFGAEGATASEFSKALGITKGIDYDLFIEFPKAEAFRKYKEQGLSDAEATQKAEYIEKSIIQEGKRSTFQQDNFLNDKLTELFRDEKSGIGAMGKSLLISPYIKIPSNAYWSYLNLAHPEIAILQAIVYGGKANRLKAKDPVAAKMALREARYWFAHAAVGFSYVGIMSSMVAAGVFTPGSTAEDTKKEREGRAYYGKPGTTNVTKLLAWLRGEDPTQIKEGYVIQNKWFGHIGTLGNAVARRELEMTPDQRVNRDQFLEGLLSSLSKDALDGLQSGIFSNTSAAFNALQSDYGLKRYGLNIIGLLTNVIHPASLAQLSRAELPYYSTAKADSFREEIKNSFLQRSSMLRKVLGEQPAAKIGVWGDKLDRKDNVAMRWFGISKENPDNFAQPLYNEFMRTGNIAYFPPTIKPEIEDKGKKTELNVRQTQELEMLIGQQRKNLVAPLLNDEVMVGKFGTWSQIEDYFLNYGLDAKEAKDKADGVRLDVLQNAYSLGFEFGKEAFLDEHPEFRNESYDKKEIQEKRKAMEKARKELSRLQW